MKEKTLWSEICVEGFFSVLDVVCHVSLSFKGTVMENLVYLLFYLFSH